MGIQALSHTTCELFGLEMRLDNIVYRMGIAPTIPAARQLVTHRHLLVNGRGVTIPSFRCRPGDQIQVRNKVSSRNLVTGHMEQWPLAAMPSHLEFDASAMSGGIRDMVERDGVGLEVDEQLVVEFYSR